MKLTQAEIKRSLLYQAGTSADSLGNLHERMRFVRQEAQKIWKQLPNDLYQAIFDLENEVSFYEPQDPPFGQRTQTIGPRLKRLLKPT